MTDKNHSTRPSVSAQVSISVVIPLYSGANYLTTLIAELDQVRNGWNSAGCPISLTEVILVDDAAADRSGEIADVISHDNDWVTAIHLARNFGQHAATIAGILHTSGDWVVTLDEDLQHPPARIEDLLRKAILNGSDVVYANADTTVHESYIRDASSWLYKRLMVWMTGNSKISSFNSFRLIRGPVARAASSTCGHDTYFDISLSWFTQRMETVRMSLKDERFIRSGKSGYSFSKLVSHARKMLMSCGARVMRSASLMGLIIIGSSVIGAAAFVVHHLFWESSILVKGWSSLIIAIVFLGGTTILLTGIILEYLASLLLNAHGKPIFFTIDRRSDALLIDYFSRNKL
jgi:undecaprenyl-phosphate 4-deoxy-4-formamido-L-arabinose transferase